MDIIETVSKNFSRLQISMRLGQYSIKIRVNYYLNRHIKYVKLKAVQCKFMK